MRAPPACDAIDGEHLRTGAHLHRFGTGALAGSAVPLLQEIPGRISLLAPPAFAGLRAGLGGNGYLIPPLLGQAAAGATYEDEPLGSAASRSDAQAHAGNLERMASLLRTAPAVQVAGVFAATRCAAPDRLPLAGALPDVQQALDRAAQLRGAHLPDLPRVQGLYCLAALGSRGLCLAALLAEAVAAQANGEPLPIGAREAAAVDPARFLLRRLR